MRNTLVNGKELNSLMRFRRGAPFALQQLYVTGLAKVAEYGAEIRILFELPLLVAYQDTESVPLAPVEVYSYRLADIIYAIRVTPEELSNFLVDAYWELPAEEDIEYWRNWRQLTKDDINTGAPLSLLVPVLYLTEQRNLSIVSHSGIPLIVALDDLRKADKFFTLDGKPIEPDHPQSPLRILGFI